MSMTPDGFLRFSAIVGAGAATFGVALTTFNFAVPISQSDRPPFANVDRVMQLAQTQQQYQRSFQEMQQTQLFLAQGFWTNQLILAKEEVRKHPDNIAAQQQLATAQQALTNIEQQLYGRK